MIPARKSGYSDRAPQAMQYCIIADIHSNLEALEAVLRRIDGLGPCTVLCLGDIVGYGGNPNECVELIRSKKIPVVAGNHDHAALGVL